MKASALSISRIGVIILISVASSAALSQSIQPTPSTSVFQKTDVSLLFEIGRNFNINRKGNSVARKRPLSPKEIRISTVRSSLDWMILKKSSSNGIIGGLVGALATTHPVGLLLGGVTGAYQGKSTRYEEAQGKLNKMEQDILVSKDYELTSEELRLASYAGTDLYEKLSMTPPSEIEVVGIKSTNNTVIEIAPPSTITSAQTTTPQPETPQIPGCYELTDNPSNALNAIQKRQLSTKCFYSMY